jgi:hypothetical protein
MYYIRKQGDQWSIHNNVTRTHRPLNPTEIESVLKEFPHLRESKNVTYFRNRLKSVTDLP